MNEQTNDMRSAERLTSQHADLLNVLDAMADNLHYAVRRVEIRQAENLIVEQECRIRELEAQLVAAERERDEAKRRCQNIKDSIVGMNVIELGTVKNDIGDAFVREELRKTLDGIEWIEQDTEQFETESEMFARTCRELEATESALAASQQREAGLRKALTWIANEEPEAGALIAAEIDRLQRAAPSTPKGQP